MGLFKPDLYRNFIIGFLVGGAAVVASVGPEWQAEFAPEAFAAEVVDQGNDSGSDFVTKAP